MYEKFAGFVNYLKEVNGKINNALKDYEKIFKKIYTRGENVVGRNKNYVGLKLTRVKFYQKKM